MEPLDLVASCVAGYGAAAGMILFAAGGAQFIERITVDWFRLMKYLGFGFVMFMFVLTLTINNVS